eukprot:10470805-Alexandrium_andersonii.AAC.1
MLRHCVDSQGQEFSGMILAVAGRGSATVSRPAKCTVMAGTMPANARRKKKVNTRRDVHALNVPCKNGAGSGD